MEKLIVTKDEDDFKFDKVSYIKTMSILTSKLWVCYLQLHLQGLVQIALRIKQAAPTYLYFISSSIRSMSGNKDKASQAQQVADLFGLGAAGQTARKGFTRIITITRIIIPSEAEGNQPPCAKEPGWQELPKTSPLQFEKARKGFSRRWKPQDPSWENEDEDDLTSPKVS